MIFGRAAVVALKLVAVAAPGAVGTGCAGKSVDGAGAGWAINRDACCSWCGRGRMIGEIEGGTRACRVGLLMGGVRGVLGLRVLVLGVLLLVIRMLRW